GDRADDGDGGARRDLLGRDGRDRARTAALHARAVHALDGGRWIPDPAGLARRRGDAAARFALGVRSPRDETHARRRLVAAAETARAAPRGTGRRARLLGPARPRDHAATVAV